MGAMTDPFPPEALLEGYPPPMREIAQALRSLVQATEPDAIERVRPGWRVIGYDVPIGRRRSAFFAWIMVEAVHTHLGFPKGVFMDDPAGLLHGAGEAKLARWVTFRHVDEIDAPQLETLVHEAARRARMPAPSRLARELDLAVRDEE